MKKSLIILVSTFCISVLISAQSVAVNTDGSIADASPIFYVKSTTKGVLVPRLTTAVPGKIKGGGNGGGNPNNRDAVDRITTATVKAIPQTTKKHQTITVGHNPDNDNFWFSVSGIETETVATLFYIDGKQIKQFRIVNLRQQQVTALGSGMYLLQIPRFETQKIIVNSGGGYGATESEQIINNNSKL